MNSLKEQVTIICESLPEIKVSRAALFSPFCEWIVSSPQVSARACDAQSEVLPPFWVPCGPEGSRTTCTSCWGWWWRCWLCWWYEEDAGSRPRVSSAAVRGLRVPSGMVCCCGSRAPSVRLPSAAPVDPLTGSAAPWKLKSCNEVWTNFSETERRQRESVRAAAAAAAAAPQVEWNPPSTSRLQIGSTRILPPAALVFTFLSLFFQWRNHCRTRLTAPLCRFLFFFFLVWKFSRVGKKTTWAALDCCTFTTLHLYFQQGLGCSAVRC